MHWLVSKFLAEEYRKKFLTFYSSNNDFLAYALFTWVIDNLKFKHRRKITITEQSGNDLTDYQVLIELNSSNFDFSHSDGNDIRFYNGEVFLPYWIEKWDSVNQEAKIWVKVPSIPANGTVSFYMYYGNPVLLSASSPELTFIRIIDDCILALPMDEGSGYIVYDKSGNDNDGSLSPGSGSVTDETFTSQYDTWVQLKHTNIDEGSETVTNTDGTVTYTRGTDYEMDYANGKIKVLSSGSMADATDYYIDYTYSNSYPTWTDGKFGKALSFDGVDDYVDCGNDESLDITNEITCEVWVYPIEYTGNPATVFSKHTAAPYSGYAIDFRENQIEWLILKDSTVCYVRTPWTAPTNRWYHIVGTFNGSIMKLYVNGEFIGEGNGALGSTAGYPLHIGECGYHGASENIKAIIDEVRIYNRALSEEEIQDLYNYYGYNTENYPGKTLVRKRVEPEPSVSIGTEETP